MSVFAYSVEAAATPAGPFQRFDAIVDSGAFYSQLPGSELSAMGVAPFDSAIFVTADGRRIESQLGELTLRIDGRERRSICVFGEEGTPPLLGAYALEGFMLGIDPVNHRLIPIEGYRLQRRLP